MLLWKKDREQVLSWQNTFVVPLFYKIGKRFYVAHMSHRTNTFNWVYISSIQNHHSFVAESSLTLSGWELPELDDVNWLHTDTSSASRSNFIFLNPKTAFWRTTFLVGVGIFLAWMSERHINWPADVQSAVLLLLLPAAPLLLLLLFFWRLPLFLPNEGESKNNLSSKPGLLVFIPWLMSNGCNEEFAV